MKNKQTVKFSIKDVKVIFHPLLHGLFLLLPTLYLAQIEQQNSSIYVSEGAVLFEQNSTIADASPKAFIYVAKGATVCNKDKIINNAQLIEVPEVSSKKVYAHQDAALKKISKKIANVQKYKGGEIEIKTKIKSNSGNRRFGNSNALEICGIITTAYNFSKLVAYNDNVGFQKKLNIYKNTNFGGLYHQNFAYKDSYHFHIFVRPPPINLF